MPAALNRCRALRRRTFSRFCYSNQPAKRPVRLAPPQREDSDSTISGTSCPVHALGTGRGILVLVLGALFRDLTRAGERRWLRHTIMLAAAKSRSGHKVTYPAKRK